MVITADAALAIAKLNLELAIQQQQAAQDSDSYNLLSEWVRHCEHAVKGWESIVNAERNPHATGGTIVVRTESGPNING